MQKIAADKVNIMECDPESTSVTINFFFKNLTQYIITHWSRNFQNLWSGNVYKKIIYQGVQENIVILNVTIFLCSDLRYLVTSNFVL